MLPSRDVAEVMAMTDLAIEPKRSTSAFGNEALSTKILEFMCLGVPVIASRTAIHQYYYDESIIQYYSNDDADELAMLMLRLKNDPARRNAMAARARRYAELNTWDARKGDYLRQVDTLVGASTDTRCLPMRSKEHRDRQGAMRMFIVVGTLAQACRRSSRAGWRYEIVTVIQSE